MQQESADLADVTVLRLVTKVNPDITCLHLDPCMLLGKLLNFVREQAVALDVS